MAGIEETKIRVLWAEHYPSWKQSPESRAVWLAISGVVKEQAAQLTARVDWSVKLSVTLTSYPLPKDQFAEFLGETGPGRSRLKPIDQERDRRVI